MSGEIAWVPFGVGRSRTVFIAAQGPLWPSAGADDARDGERIRSRELSRTGLARVCGDLRTISVGGSGRRRCRQAGSGMARSRAKAAAELLSPRPAIRKMQGQPACRAGEPSGQGEEPPPEGLGGGYPLSQTDPRRPAGQVVGHRLDGQPGAVGGEAARGEMVQPDAVLEVAYGILDLGVAATVSLQFEQLPVPVR